MKKTIIFVLIVVLLISLCACADPTNQTRLATISLPVKDGAPIPTEAEFTVVNAISYGGYCYYEILPNQFDEFLKLLENLDYFCGYVTIANTSMLQYTNSFNPFKDKDECMWFSNSEKVWIGKKYTDKFFYFAQTKTSLIRGDNFNCWLNLFLLSNDNTTPETEKEYETYLSWNDIKKVYENNPIDEEAHSIKLNCNVFENEENPHFSKDGYTTLVYNEENSTIKILNEYIKK
ncbi:MAG: hypothetical protein K2J89_00045 [Clostridia bacterium]|nr:hypothetical protein [Clostridia bacterium]